MSEFGLDLRTIEDMIDDENVGTADSGGAVVLDILDGSTDDEEWVELVGQGNVLVLDIDGDLETLASGFAPKIQQAGGELVHFRSFLIVTPPGIAVNTERL